MIRKYLRTFATFLWLTITLLSAGLCTQAEETAQTLLFSVRVNDGYQTIDLPVYGQSAGNAVSISGMQSTAQVINPASKSVTAEIVDRTAYFTQHYTRAKVTASIALKKGKTGQLKVRVKDSGGQILRCRLKLYRPKKPSVTGITLNRRTIKSGKTLKATIGVKSRVPVTLAVTVADSTGSVVYEETIGSSEEKNPAFVWKWKGMRSDGSAIEKGKYTLTFTLQYTYGRKTKTVTETMSIKAKNAAASTTVSPVTADPVLSDFTKSWGWTVMVTGDDTIDYVCELICQQVLTSGMSQVQRAKALFNYCAGHFTSTRINSEESAASLPEQIDVSSAAAVKRIAAYSDVLRQMTANGSAVVNTSGKLAFSAGNTKTALTKWCGDCTNFARMYQALCRHAGLDADYLHNSLDPVTDPLSHYWNVVKIDGVWYECDPRMSFLRGEGYVHFARGTTFMETYNAAEGNYNDDVRRYSNIDPAYMDIYAKLSASDCPER